MYNLIRLVQLQKFNNLRVSVNPLQNVFSAFSNSFSSASAAADVSLRDVRKDKTCTVSYLVGSLGLTTKLAESISKKVCFEHKGNPDSVLNLLRSHGFTDSQICSIITTYPGLLLLDAEKSIGPKLQFLQSREGASTSELTEILSKVPKILGMRWEKAISVYYDFVKEIIVADKSSKFEKLCHSSLPQEGSKQRNKMRNLSVLRELGMPQKLLFSMLISDHRCVCGKERFEETLKKVVELGFDTTTTKFVQALRVVYGMSDKTLDEKVQVYKRLGFTVKDVWTMFKKWPMILTYSEKKISQTFETMNKCGLLEDEVRLVFNKFPQCNSVSEQNILDSTEAFLGLGFSRDEFTTMVKRFPMCIVLSTEKVKKKTEFIAKNWPLKSVVSIPAVLGLSMEKRIVPRCNVINALMSKGLLGREFPSMGPVLVRSDVVFLNQFVRKHDDKELVDELMAIFTRKETDKTCE